MFESLIESTYQALQDAASMAVAAGKFLYEFDGGLTADVGLGGSNHAKAL